jgi:hypothetical protein
MQSLGKRSESMDVQPGEFKRLFTVEEANATLPLVQAICRDLSALAREVVERRERLTLLSGNRKDRPDLYSEELQQIEDELDKDYRQLQEYVEELRELGVEPKNGIEGLVDFPSLMDDRVVFLCWKLDEPEVLYWHEVDGGFAGRQPLTAGSGALGDLFDDDVDGLP